MTIDERMKETGFLYFVAPLVTCLYSLDARDLGTVTADKRMNVAHDNRMRRLCEKQCPTVRKINSIDQHRAPSRRFGRGGSRDRRGSDPCHVGSAPAAHTE
jgi:hypothetical protein